MPKAEYEVYNNNINHSHNNTFVKRHSAVGAGAGRTGKLVVSSIEQVSF